MNIKKILLVVVLFSSHLSFAANEQTNFYIGVFGAYSVYPEYKPKPEAGKQKAIGIDYVKNGFNTGVNIGYKFTDNFSADIEYSYRKHVFDKFKLIADVPEKGFTAGQVIPLGKKFGFVHTHSVMLNGYFELPTQNNLIPFAAIGAGITRYEERNECGNYHTNSPSMQVSLGLGYKINESLRLDAGIKHFHMKDTNITNKCLSPKIKYRTNEGFLGLKYFI